MDIRIRQAERNQAGFEVVDLESLVVEDHPVRAVWSFVEGLDLHWFYDRIKARGETPGRAATDPRILLTLWLYATADGIGSARALARLCEHHTIYRWICGGVGVNHTMLSEFRTPRRRDSEEAPLDCSQRLTTIHEKFEELFGEGLRHILPAFALLGIAFLGFIVTPSFSNEQLYPG